MVISFESNFFKQSCSIKLPVKTHTYPLRNETFEVNASLLKLNKNIELNPSIFVRNEK